MKRTYLLLLGLGLYFSLQAGEIAWSQVTERVSVDSAGFEGNSASTAPSISSDGRYVAFESQADNLVANDTNTDIDIFVHDRQTGETTRVSVDSAGVQGSGDSNFPSISGDGMHVAFQSDAELGGIDANPFSDIFVRDRQTGATTLVSVDSNGFQDIGFGVSPSVSSNGRYVAFESDGNLVFDDTGVAPDIFVHDRDADEDGIYDEAGAISTVRVSVRSDGTEANQASTAPSISSDGRYVAFESVADNLVAGDTLFPVGFRDVFVRDRDADGDGIYDEPAAISTVRVSVDSVGVEGDNDSNFPSISADGRYVAFQSDATNLVADDTNGKTDVFVHDLQTGTTTRVSVDLADVEGNGNSTAPSMSADGKSVTFQSDADNLVASDTNAAPDIFADDLQAGDGGGGGGGSSSGGGGCFISTAASGSVKAKEK